MNLVTVKVTQMQTTSSNLYEDPDFGEPAAPMTYASEVTLEGQVNFGSKQYEELLRSLTGNAKSTFGHCVFKNPIVDTSGSSVTLAIGDKITEIAGETMELYITEVRPESPLNGEFLLWYVSFTDNQEERDTN